MKRITILIGVCFLVCLLGACATSETNVVKQSTVGEMVYSYVDIDPLVIGNTWGEPVERVSLNQFVVEMYFKNPDIDAPIQFATLVVTPAGIGGYSYMLYGKINTCQFNTETTAYESTWADLSEESKQVWRNDYKTYFGLDNL